MIHSVCRPSSSFLLHLSGMYLFRLARCSLIVSVSVAILGCSPGSNAVVLPTVDLRSSAPSSGEAAGGEQPGANAGAGGPDAGDGGTTQASPRTGSSAARSSGGQSSSTQQTQSGSGSASSSLSSGATGSTGASSGTRSVSDSGTSSTGSDASDSATASTTTTSSDQTTSSAAQDSTGEGSSSTKADSSSGSSDEKGSGSGDSTAEAKTCLPLCEKGTKDAFVDCVVEFKPAPETAHYVEEYEVTDPETGQKVTKTREYFGWNHDKMPGIVLGPPGGVFDTVSLGCEGSLTVGFVDPPLIDGPGPDLIVFENPFAEIFPEPVRVEVSDDACTWVEFPCNPVTLEGCGGVSVVKALPGKNIDPTDPKVAGGDAFDLADIGVKRARFVRVFSVSREYWLAKENTEKWCDPGPMTTGKGGSDIDAFALVHAPVEPPQ